MFDIRYYPYLRVDSTHHVERVDRPSSPEDGFFGFCLDLPPPPTLYPRCPLLHQMQHLYTYCIPSLTPCPCPPHPPYLLHPPNICLEMLWQQNTHHSPGYIINRVTGCSLGRIITTFGSMCTLRWLYGGMPSLVLSLPCTTVVVSVTFVLLIQILQRSVNFRTAWRQVWMK